MTGSSVIARWDRGAWQVLGNPPFKNADLASLTMYARSGLPALHATRTEGSNPPLQFARWDGASWVSLGPAPPLIVRASAVFDGGDGPCLFLGGTPNGQLFPLLRWNGATWLPVAGLASAGPGAVFQVQALEVFDDGSGPALYVAGAFASAGGVPAFNIARWDGRVWEPLGPGISGYVNDMAVYDDGRGESLFIGGNDMRVRSYAGQTTDYAVVQWVGCRGQCYPDCNNDGAITVSDFGCFQTQFVQSNPYADCNQDVAFTVADFGCFQTRFVAGCP